MEDGGWAGLCLRCGWLAFVLWAAKAEVAVAVRDRFAIKPLYFAATPNGVAFASEIKQLLAIPGVERRMNIARIYDGGVTPTGQPFFVMELVQGVPLTDYCDAHRLSVAARLELFVSVCQAVQHAHQKGIIHRDLKPANIALSGHDQVKVLDFGLAKLVAAPAGGAPSSMSMSPTLTTPAMMTGVGMIIGTAAYIAP